MDLTDKQKTELILNCLIKDLTSYNKIRSNILFPELRLGSGYCGISQRRIDLFVISSNAGNDTTSYEIKVSRQDFKKDVNDDLKQRGARLYSNYFYYVTPVGLLKKEEIPLWAGLLEVDLQSKRNVIIRDNYPINCIVPAPLNPKANPSWGLICSMIRHINKDCGIAKIAELEHELETKNRQLKSQQYILEQLANNEKTVEDLKWELLKYRK